MELIEKLHYLQEKRYKMDTKDDSGDTTEKKNSLFSISSGQFMDIPEKDRVSVRFS